MKYVHYRHFNKRWFYWINDNPNKYFSNHGSYALNEVEFAFYGATHAQAKNILNGMFNTDDYCIIRAIPFHQSNSYYLSNGRHRGSRE